MLENNSAAPGGDVSTGGGAADVPGSSGAADRTDRMQERAATEANPRTQERHQEAAPEPRRATGKVSARTCRPPSESSRS
jgi:hypothetical protein